MLKICRRLHRVNSIIVPYDKWGMGDCPVLISII